MGWPEVRARRSVIELARRGYYSRGEFVTHGAGPRGKIMPEEVRCRFFSLSLMTTNTSIGDCVSLRECQKERRRRRRRGRGVVCQSREAFPSWYHAGLPLIKIKIHVARKLPVTVSWEKTTGLFILDDNYRYYILFFLILS